MSQIKEKMKLGDADKEALKTGAKTCCYKFSNFVDKFTELIFCKFGLFDHLSLSSKWLDHSLSLGPLQVLHSERMGSSKEEI